MKVLVFGSGSKTAYSLYNQVDKENIQNFIWSSGKEKPEWYKEENWIVGNFNDEEFIKQIIKDIKPTHIVNLSAMTDVDGCEDEKQQATITNHMIPELISELSKEYNFNFIHISTDYVFDGQQGLYEIDDELPLPSQSLNWYAITKRTSEENVLKNNGCVIRTNVLYGSDFYQNDFVSIIKNKLKNSEIPLAVVDQFNNPTNLKDLANTILIAIEKDIKGIIHTGGLDWGSRWEFAQVIAIFQNINPMDGTIISVLSDYLNQKAKRPKFGGLGVNKSEELLDYKFSGLYDYLLENTEIEKLIDKEENPKWTILNNMVKILRIIPNSLRKKTKLDFFKNQHGTVSIFISNEYLYSEIEIGRTTLSGLLFKKVYDESGNSSLDLIQGDVFTFENMPKFFDEVENLLP